MRNIFKFVNISGENMEEEVKSDIKKVLFALSFAEFNDTKLSIEEYVAIKHLQEYVDEEIIDLDSMRKKYLHNPIIEFSSF